MQYTIEGDTLPVVICELNPGESMISQSGARTWSKGDILTESNMEGGLGRGLGRMFSGESLFMSRYTARGPGLIAFGSSFPGRIIACPLNPGQSVVCQKRAFLAATPDVNLSVFFQRRFGAGIAGGEGFIMQRVTGPGVVFLEIDGHSVIYDLVPGERVVCDTGAVAWMDETCTLDIEVVKGIKNVLFGNEGLFNTVVTGPGKVCLQTMSVSQLAALIRPYIPSK